MRTTEQVKLPEPSQQRGGLDPPHSRLEKRGGSTFKTKSQPILLRTKIKYKSFPELWVEMPNKLSDEYKLESDEV